MKRRALSVFLVQFLIVTQAAFADSNFSAPRKVTVDAVFAKYPQTVSEQQCRAYFSPAFLGRAASTKAEKQRALPLNKKGQKIADDQPYSGPGVVFSSASQLTVSYPLALSGFSTVEHLKLRLTSFYASYNGSSGNALLVGRPNKAAGVYLTTRYCDVIFTFHDNQSASNGDQA